MVRVMSETLTLPHVLGKHLFLLNQHGQRLGLAYYVLSHNPATGMVRCRHTRSGQVSEIAWVALRRHLQRRQAILDS